jgi:hypothetical protein
MNASADLQLALASSRCGFRQLDMLPNVAWGQNCLMSFAHCLAVQEAFDRIVEQPTDRSLACKCRQPKTRPPPGMTRAHRDQTSAVQSRSEVNNASCAAALQEPVSSNAAPNAIADNGLVMALPPVTHAHAAPDSLTHSDRSQIAPRQAPSIGKSSWTIVVARAPPARPRLVEFRLAQWWPVDRSAARDASGGVWRAVSGAGSLQHRPRPWSAQGRRARGRRAQRARESSPERRLRIPSARAP